MSVNSTITISRVDALKIIIEALNEAPNDTVSSILNDLVGGSNPTIKYPGIFYNNFSVVDEYSDYDYRSWKDLNDI